MMKKQAVPGKGQFVSEIYTKNEPVETNIGSIRDAACHSAPSSPLLPVQVKYAGLLWWVVLFSFKNVLSVGSPLSVSPCHLVALSSCHPVALSPCPLVACPLKQPWPLINLPALGKQINHMHGLDRQVVLFDITLLMHQAGRIGAHNIFGTGFEGMKYFLFGHSS